MGNISVHVSGRDRESRSREVSARLRVRSKFVARMRSREFCHVKHVGTRHSCHSDHKYFSPLQQTTTLQLAAYCVHCFLRQCMRVLTMAPPTPPISFVSQGLRGQRLVGRPFRGVVVLAFSNLFHFWGRAVERPRSNGKCSPEGCTCSGRGLAKRPPQGLKSSPEKAKMTSWRAQMAGKTAPEALLGGAWAGRKRSWAALGVVLAALVALLAALWAVLTRPGVLREASGGSGEGLREAMLVLF